MIQLNLLPDVKLEYLKAQRLRRLVIAVSVLATAASVLVMIILLSVTIFQHKQLTDLSKDIQSKGKQISGQTDLNKILTVQNQLASLTQLHNAKPAATRLSDYLSQVTPAQANINNLSIDFNQHTLTITGTADSLATVNKYVDTLKFTTYAASGGSSQSAFSGVVLSSFSITQHEVDYTITLSYDQNIFDITQDVKLTVPNEVTTRSQLDQPTDLFQLPKDSPTTTKAAGSTR